MKLIEAAESGYASANTYFLLLWGIVAVVGLTAFFELREIEADEREAKRIIGLYEDLIDPVERVQTGLTQVVSASPHFDDPGKLFAELRANALRSRVLVRDIGNSLTLERQISAARRQAINEPANTLQALLHYNLATGQGDWTAIPGKPALHFVDVEIGKLEVADDVAGLRIEDGARFLWLASIPMRDLVARGPILRRLAASDTPADLDRLATELAGFADRAEEWLYRETANALWVAWMRAMPEDGPEANSQLERFAMKQLAMAQPLDLTVEAFRTRSLAEARRSGNEVDVSLPGLSLPIRLSDALVFLPALVAFCLLAIFVYTSRGLRYGTRENLRKTGGSHEIVGGAPVYFALYGVTKPVGWLIAAMALALPLAITVALPLWLIPSVLQPGWPTWVFWIGVAVGLELLFMLLIQIGKVTELIDEGTVLPEEE